MRAATTHSSGTTLFTFTALKCAITPIPEVASHSNSQRWAKEDPERGKTLGLSPKGA